MKEEERDIIAKIGDIISADATDGPVTVILPKINEENNDATITVKEMDPSVNIVTTTDYCGGDILLTKPLVFIDMVARNNSWYPRI